MSRTGDVAIGTGIVGGIALAESRLGQIHLGQQGLGTVLVDTAVVGGVFLGQQFDGLLQDHDDVVIDRADLGLVQGVRLLAVDDFRRIVNDGNSTERAYQVEISHSLPG